ncbi:hypothetical protein ACFFMM_24920 [Micromonospora chaiyaphumensis]|uniref:Uncharacterized protein n=1 Tax=Micromonospora chaiyaphumensis TaxID=307119 RepID=A0A1C4ULX5_9ACTN|nr:hypothetical protein [Micromonospora chaiyaphumensis]SCE72642.1 hypothetical protein GA0070214_101822 [Micromonospora chaiyaphumensis]
MGNGRQDPGAPRAAAADLPRPGAEDDQHHSGPTMADPDVVLQIPHLRVDDICAEVDDLDAHVSLRARLGGLLQLDVGAQARLGTVRIDIRGVTTEAMLEVRLDELNGILDRAFSTVDRNPQIVEAAVRTAGTTAGRVGRTTPPAPGPPPREPADTAGGATGSAGRTAWRRMKKIAKDGRPLRRAAARLLPGTGPEPRRDG